MTVEMDNLEGTRINVTALQLVRRHAEDVSNRGVSRGRGNGGAFRDEDNEENDDETSADDDEELNVQQATTSGGGLNANNHPKDLHDAFVAREAARMADCVGWCVMLSLIAVGGILATITFFFVSGGERDDFEKEFDVVSEEVFAGVERNSKILYSQLDLLARLFPSTHQNGNDTTSSSTWVVTTVNEFEAFAMTIRAALNLALIVYAPWLGQNTSDSDWALYSEQHAETWIQHSYAMHPDLTGQMPPPPRLHDVWILDNVTGQAVKEDSTAPQAPAWQWSGPPLPNQPNMINYNLNQNPIYLGLANQSVVAATDAAFLSQPFDLRSLYGTAFDPLLLEQSAHSFALVPIVDTLEYNNNNNNNSTPRRVTGHLSAAVPWTFLFTNILQAHQQGLHAVVNSCYNTAIHTYLLNGPSVEYLGQDDLHDTSYNELARSSFYYGLHVNRTQIAGFLYCRHEIIVYPTSTYEIGFTTNDATVYTVTIVTVMLFAIVLFLSYDCIIRKQQSKVLGEAERSNAIVASLFPGKVARRLFLDTSRHSASGLDMSEGRSTHSVNLLNFMSKGDVRVAEASKPIAELFPDATVMFADIAGFTAWSSIREPSQVFTLLESIFQSFDVIAKSFGVFKVETVGDCYVACCGVPENNEDHATVMAQFARECMRKFNQVVLDLELKLGPDTSDLAIRIGLNSGPVTAGVLRGERARFQLFGDTVNTASRMESTGQKGRIHLSEQTANILIAQGRGSWVKPREDKVMAKGKGTLSTYWLEEVATPRLWARDTTTTTTATATTTAKGPSPTTEAVVIGADTTSVGRDGSDATNDHISTRAPPRPAADAIKPEPAPIIPVNIPALAQADDRKIQRLIDWNTELLMQLLKQVVARRYAVSGRRTTPDTLWEMARSMGGGHMPVDEVLEVIVLPDFDERAIHQVDPETVILSPEVTAQCRNYVALLASMYRKNPFHNFEHASHVTMSVSKLLSRIVAPEVDKEKLAAGMHQELLLHDHTYGITSDPLTQFSVVLSALIHDVDHRGVPNFLLIAEDERLAAIYQKKSVAEQNSVDLAWKALMRPDFSELRSCIFSDVKELKRFRALVVNSVIATDIFDKELGTLRKNRWAKAFSETNPDSHTRQDVNRKATIVIEHLIQASDVAHTMQHWHVYQKWNERLFHEMYSAHKSGRWDKDPSQNWFQGEIGFFDNYIIPLAKKLKECGVFGVASDEYLNYALQNRKEWEIKGTDLVGRLVAKYGVPNEGDEEMKSELVDM